MSHQVAQQLRESFTEHFESPEGVTSGEDYPVSCPSESDEDWIIAYYETDTHIVSIFALGGSDAVQPFYETEGGMWWGEPGHTEQVAVDVEQQLR